MDKTERTVAGLDVHKDSVFLCIMEVSGIKFIYRICRNFREYYTIFRKRLATRNYSPNRVQFCFTLSRKSDK